MTKPAQEAETPPLQPPGPAEAMTSLFARFKLPDVVVPPLDAERWNATRPDASAAWWATVACSTALTEALEGQTAHLVTRLHRQNRRVLEVGALNRQTLAHIVVLETVLSTRHHTTPGDYLKGHEVAREVIAEAIQQRVITRAAQVRMRELGDAAMRGVIDHFVLSAQRYTSLKGIESPNPFATPLRLAANAAENSRTADIAAAALSHLLAVSPANVGPRTQRLPPGTPVQVLTAEARHISGLISHSPSNGKAYRIWLPGRNSGVFRSGRLQPTAAFPVVPLHRRVVADPLTAQNLLVALIASARQPEEHTPRDPHLRKMDRADQHDLTSALTEWSGLRIEDLYLELEPDIKNAEARMCAVLDSAPEMVSLYRQTRPAATAGSLPALRAEFPQTPVAAPASGRGPRQRPTSQANESARTPSSGRTA
ncbi:hypothetical protein [Thermomonospora umbrina]|uniref:Uncharacterized protein n=1 Tax=Thermomonospora umbrina TaxID=111806 RepID=A0A3D9SXG0_9ACTN|nr:hypothetical protein [Thermomonospora umbrina]REF00643.1 hypothetical protein DFJ69_6199 [Thermomonospora umbrina]